MLNPSISRRTVLAGAGAAAAATAAAPSLATTSATKAGHSGDYPFGLGVAAGDPTATSAIIWTRIFYSLDRPMNGGHGCYTLDWQVSETQDFATIVAEGRVNAWSHLGESAHVDVRGLRPAAEYFYRFRYDGHISPVGRFRTLPAADATPTSFLLAVANCQNYQAGYYGAYNDLASAAPDLALHLGDYIYEYDPYDSAARKHTVASLTAKGGDQLFTLADYRDRYSQYKMDPALQAAHAATAFVPTWDDHEVEDNYVSLIDQLDDFGNPVQWQDETAMAYQRGNAYQVWYENMPVRANFMMGAKGLKIFRRFAIGQLANIHMLDSRQYRTEQPEGGAWDFGTAESAESNTDGTVLGAEQERWIDRGITASTAVWDILGQQMQMFPVDHFIAAPWDVTPEDVAGAATWTASSHPTIVRNLDTWDGYPAARSRMLDTLEKARNPIVLTGDWHSQWAADVHREPRNIESAIVASEFVTTGLSSTFWETSIPAMEASIRIFDQWVKYFEGSEQGWSKITITPTEFTCEARYVDTIATPDAGSSTGAKHVVTADQRGVHSA